MKDNKMRKLSGFEIFRDCRYLKIIKKSFASILIVSSFYFQYAFSQVADFDFENDTVCVNDSIKVFNYSSGALTYQWIFESAIITPDASVEVIPDVIIPLDAQNHGGPVYIDAVREGNNFYTFVSKHLGNAGIWIQKYGNSFDNTPTNWEMVNIPTANIEGLDIEKDDDSIYYGIICAGTSDAIFRVTFISGIDTTPVLVESLGFSNFTSFPHDINLIKQNGIWYAMISNSNPSWKGKNLAITILKFNDGLGGDISTIDAWNFSPFDLGLTTSNLQGIATIKIDGKWYAMITSTTGYMLRVEFNDDFTKARAFNLGDINGTLNQPRDISMISDCGMLTGFVVNVGDNSLGILHFDDGIKGTVWGEKKDFNGVYAYPHAISDVYRFGGDAIVIIPEVSQGKLIKLKFTPSGGHINTPFPNPSDFQPSFSYDTAGTYYVSLSVNSDIASTVCKGIVVIDKPNVPVISSDPVCSGDSLKLSVYDDPNANYHWTYPDNSTSSDKYPIILDPGIYKLSLSYGACFSPEASDNVSVLALPSPNVLPVPAKVCQWENIQLFGNASGGSPPYITHNWSGYGDFLFDSLEISDPYFMGRMGIEEEDYYLSDLMYSFLSFSNRPPINDKTVEGNPIDLLMTLNKGLGMEPQTKISYFTNKYYDYFRAKIGIDDAITSCGTVEFLVYARDSLIYNSGILNSFSPIQTIDISISAFDTISLMVKNGGDDDFCDIADWGNARFVKNPPRITYDLIYSVTDNYGCSNKDTILVDVDTNDVHINIQAKDTLVCPGESAYFLIKAYGPSIIDYQWQKFNGSLWTNLNDDARINGTQTDSINLSSIISTDEGQYRCVMATLPCGKDTSNTTNLIIKPVPTITDTFPVSSCGPDTVTLSAIASMGTIQWFDTPSGGIALDTSNYFVINNLTQSKTFYLQPEASGCFAVVRTPITAHYYDIPIIDSIFSKDASLCNLTDGELTVFAHGSSNLDYSIDSGNTWQPDSLFTLLLMGLYDVSVRYDNALCIIQLDSIAQIKSLSAPLISNITSAGETDCGMDNGTITVSVTGGTGLYEFSNNSGSSWQTLNVFSSLSPGDYHVIVRNNDGTCLVEYPKIITVDGYDEPVFNNPPSTINVSDCDSADGSITIDASGNTEQLIYSIDSAANWNLIQTFSNLSPNNYSIAISYISGKCVTYYGAYTQITQPKRPVITSVEVFPVSKCFNPDGHITINADFGEGNYEYTNNAGQTWLNIGQFLNLSAGGYDLFVRNGDLTCETKLDSTVLVEDKCKDTLVNMLCIDGNDVILDNYLNTISDTGVWSEINTNSILVVNKFNTNGLVTGKYFFAYDIENNKFVFEFDATEQKYAGNPINYFSCTNKVNLFNGLEIGTFTEGGNWYNVDNGKKLSDSIVNQSGGQYNYMYYHEQEYACKPDSSLVSISVDTEKPEIYCDSIAKLDFVVPTGGEYYEFLNNAILPKASDNNCNVVSITNSWNNENSLLNAKMLPGPYKIKWIATDQAGNQSSCVSNINIRDFIIPNIFTPNSDGFNDTWDFSISEKYPEAVIEIYNQFGKLIYSSTKGYPSPWDGKINGKLVPADAYYYIINNKGKVIYKGSLTVVY